MLTETVLSTLKETVRGAVITKDDKAYDSARAIYNAMIDKYPESIVQCEDARDVVEAVNFARENGVRVSVRGGGHNGPGLALVDDGLVIDLSKMNSVQVDPEARTVRVGGGAVWREVDQATHAFGMATPSGVIGSTGVGGLTLGGGHGYLTRKYGLTVDNLLEADVVLANGEKVKASPDQNPDLFWAIRGGGGNFGVVTSFLFRLHPVKNVVAGPMFWEVEDAQEIMAWYDSFMAKAPRDVYAFFANMVVPPAPPFPEEIQGRKVCGLMWCLTLSEDEAAPFLDEVRAFKKPIFEHVGEVPFPALQTLFDDLYPKGLQWYWKGDFVKKIDQAELEIHQEFLKKIPTGHSTMHLYPIDGAVHDKKPEDTAFRFRDARWSMVVVGVDPDPANAEKITRWAKDYWEALNPHTMGAAYINFMMQEGADRIEATYGDNYPRLRKIKAKYDPDNFFRINQNIEPAS